MCVRLCLCDYVCVRVCHLETKIEGLPLLLLGFSNFYLNVLFLYIKIFAFQILDMGIYKFSMGIYKICGVIVTVFEKPRRNMK